MRSFLAALQFMTILPVRASFDKRCLERAPVWFPPVGLMLGLAVALADGCGARIGLPPNILNVFSVALLAALSGGLHLDGLADTADGFLSARPRERALEIMRDSRIGVMGVLALIFVLTLKYVALTGLAGALRWRALVSAPLAGRAMLLIAPTLLPYARKDGGLANVFFRRRRPFLAVWALAWLAGAAVGFLGVAEGLGLVAVCTFGTLLLGAWSKRRIGGFTGDTLGATSEVVEALALVSVCVL